MGNLLIKKTNLLCGHHLLLSQIEIHSVNIKSLIHSHNYIKHCVIYLCGQSLTRLYIDRIKRLTYRERLSGLHIKNKKFLPQKCPYAPTFKSPKVNLTSRILSGRKKMKL